MFAWTTESIMYLGTENLMHLSPVVDFVEKNMKVFHSFHVSVFKTFAHLKQQHLFVGFWRIYKHVQKCMCSVLEQSQKVTKTSLFDKTFIMT